MWGSKVLGLVLIAVVLGSGLIPAMAANLQDTHQKYTTKSYTWLEVLKDVYRLYDVAMNYLWSEEPDTTVTPYYVTAKTGTIEFNKPLSSDKVHAVIKYMPGWENYDLEVHGNCYCLGDITVTITGFWNGHYHLLGTKKLTHNQYYWKEAPKTLPNSENQDGYMITWVDEDWEKWVLWHRSYTPYHSGGCPYIASWNGKSYVPENTILVKSEYLKERNSPNIRDYYLIKNQKSIRNGYYTFQLQEFENEISHIDSAKLLVIEHDPAVRIATSSDGTIVPYKDNELKLPIKAIDNLGKDVSEALEKSSLKRDGGGWVELEFGPVESENLALLIAPKVKKANSPILVQKWNGENWETVGEIYPRNDYFVEAVKLKFRKPQNELKVRLLWTSYHEIKLIGLVAPLKKELTIYELQLSKAIDSANKDITKKLRNLDGIYAKLKPNENITLYFSIPEKLSASRDLV